MTNNSPNPRNKCVALIPQGNLVHWTCSQSTINHSNVVNQFQRSSKTLCFKGSSDHHMSAFGVKQDGFATPVASFPPKYSPNNGMDGYGWMTCFDLFLRSRHPNFSIRYHRIMQFNQDISNGQKWKDCCIILYITYKKTNI